MQRFSTDGIAPSDRFASWREAVFGMFARLDLVRADPVGGFHASARTEQAGPVYLSRFLTNSMDAIRLPRHARIDQKDDCFLALQLRGRARVDQHGRRIILQPGDFTLLDVRYPYEIDFRGSPADHLVVHLRRSAIEEMGIDLISVAARPVRANSVGGRLVVPFLVTAEKIVHQLSTERRESLGQLCVQHVASALDQDAHDSGTWASTPHEVQLSEVQAYMLTNLADRHLDPAQAAAALGISVRQVHRLFASADTTFGTWLRGERLRRCHSDLTRGRLGSRSIAHIGAQWGLADPAVFSRMFRRAYAASPSEVRRQAVNMNRAEPEVDLV